MPKLREETFGSGDFSWLASTHGIRNAGTKIVDISEWTSGTHYPDGYIKSGTPAAIENEKLVPYTVASGTTTGRGILAGFILTDSKVVGSDDFAVAFIRHGSVRVSKVPYASFEKPIAAKNDTHIVFES